MQQPATARQVTKQTAIMEAMFGLVHQYGYAKITMDDIARASGLSRPALYQFFRNKQEIYRAFASNMLEECLAKMDVALEEGREDALKEGDPVKDRIFNALKAGVLDPIAEMESTTHGSELLDLKNDLSADIIEHYAEGILSRLTVQFGKIDAGLPLPAEAMAANLFFWMEGMKTLVKDPKAREGALRGFLEMQFAAIANGSAAR